MEEQSGILLNYAKEFFQNPALVKFWEKSRRVGASWSCAAVASVRAGAKPGSEIRSMNVWYIGYNQDMAREFVEDAGFWARQYQIAAEALQSEFVRDGDKDIRTFYIRFASGFRLTALSSRPTNLRGKQGLVIIDEAAFHDDLKGLLKAAIALLMWGGEVWVLSSHNGAANEFNEVIEDCRAGRKPYYVHRTTLDDALADGLYKRICLKLQQPWSEDLERLWRQDLIEQYGEDANEELFCVPSNGEGKYFGLWILERSLVQVVPVLTYHCTDEFAAKSEKERIARTQDWLELEVRPVVEKHINQNWLTFFGMDFARSGDLSVFCPLQEQDDLVKVCPFALELRNVPFEQQKQIVFFTVGLFKKFMFGALDATGNGSYLAEVCWQKWGQHRIERVNLSRSFYLEHYPRYRADLQEGRTLLPRRADWKNDHRLVELDKGVPTLPDKTIKGADGLPRHGDSATAGLLANYATTCEYHPEPEWHPIDEPDSVLQSLLDEAEFNWVGW